ncbi:hypothetical protein GGI05_006737, partial [Coemansia sp. RSA 2603]
IATLLFLNVLEQNSSDLFRLPGRASFSSAQINQIEALLANIIEEVREQAIPLVDAFGMSDLRLNSALGRSDGKVYEDYLQWAMEDPLNTDDTGKAIRKEWFEKYYKPVMHGNKASNKSAKL